MNELYYGIIVINEDPFHANNQFPISCTQNTSIDEWFSLRNIKGEKVSLSESGSWLQFIHSFFTERGSDGSGPKFLTRAGSATSGFG